MVVGIYFKHTVKNFVTQIQSFPGMEYIELEHKENKNSIGEGFIFKLDKFKHV